MKRLNRIIILYMSLFLLAMIFISPLGAMKVKAEEEPTITSYEFFTNLTYNGEDQPLCTATASDGAAVEYCHHADEWYDHAPTRKDVGTYYGIKIRARRDTEGGARYSTIYEGTPIINPKSITDFDFRSTASITVGDMEHVYDGALGRPNIVIRWKGENVTFNIVGEQSDDYGSGYKNVGYYDVVVEGTGNFEGQLNLTVSGYCGQFKVLHTGEHVYDYKNVENRAAKKSAATCKSPATYYYSCSVSGCREVEKDDSHTFTSGEKAAHSLGGYAYNETNHWKACSVCGDKSGVTAHSLDQNGKCVCGYAKEKEEEESKKITVTFNAENAGGSLNGGASATYEPGKAYGNLPGVITNDGYVFSGWYTAKNGGTKVTESSLVPVEDHTLYAQWHLKDIPFNDIPADKYYTEAVDWAVKNNITKGISDAEFGVNLECSRAQMATFQWRAAGCPEPKSNKNSFTDIKEGSYYYKAVLWAVENGITSGTSATTFSPNNILDRAQAVTLLWRANGSPKVENDGRFKDVPKGAYYETAVYWAAKNGITSGTSANTFSAKNNCERGQTVTFLYRNYAK